MSKRTGSSIIAFVLFKLLIYRYQLETGHVPFDPKAGDLFLLKDHDFNTFKLARPTR